MAEELKKLDLNHDPVEASKPITTEVVQVAAGPKTPSKPWLVFIAIIVLGIASGYGLFRILPGQVTSAGVSTDGQLTAKIKVGDMVGSTDDKTFKDTATGVLEAGTTSGEGSHQLRRSGGPSKTANLTSSVIDLDQFVGMEVQVWGETFNAQKSGWLMDVGRIKVLQLSAPIPE